ncbi:bacteriocin-processing peptidase [Clostridium pasteurianum DSM 525 = ATCC 6013]|nr:bacteriocin-processing peptidase [Clostridium pasteurianum DSM 525 = ATCC 6013]
MDKGIIIESGSHNELIKQGGKYFKLWKEQLPGYEALEEVASAKRLEVNQI